VTFHRITDRPSTYVGSDTQDWLNDPVKNSVPTGVPALVLPDVGQWNNTGPNIGSYFVGWRDAGASAAVNRCFYALGENTDYLDDITHRAVATIYEVPFTATAGQTTIDLDDDQWYWTGDPGDDLADIAVVVGGEGDARAQAATLDGGVLYKVDVIHIVQDGANVENTGWIEATAAHPVHLKVDVDLIEGSDYIARVHGRNTIATFNVTDLSLEDLRAHDASYGVQNALFKILGHGDYYSVAPEISLNESARRGFDECYRRKSGSPSTVDGRGTTKDTAGAGGAIYRDGYSPKILSTLDLTHTYGVLPAGWVYDATNHPLDTGLGSFGFVALGFHTVNTSTEDYQPMVASFASFGNTSNNNTSPCTRTKLDGLYDCSMTLDGSGYSYDVTLTDTDSPYFSKDQGGGDYQTDIALKTDVFLVTRTSDGKTRAFVMESITDTTHAVLRSLDGQTYTDWTGTFAGTIKWLKTRFFVGEGLSKYKARLNDIGTAQHENRIFPGLFMVGGPMDWETAGNRYPAAYFGSGYYSEGQVAVIEWGSFSKDVSISYNGHRTLGSLMSDGQISLTPLTDMVAGIDFPEAVADSFRLALSSKISSTMYSRIYVGTTGFLFSVNAVMDTTTAGWTRDSTGVGAVLWDVNSSTGITQYTAPAGSGAISWTELNGIDNSQYAWSNEDIATPLQNIKSSSYADTSVIATITCGVDDIILIDADVPSRNGDDGLTGLTQLVAIQDYGGAGVASTVVGSTNMIRYVEGGLGITNTSVHSSLTITHAGVLRVKMQVKSSSAPTSGIDVGVGHATLRLTRLGKGIL